LGDGAIRQLRGARPRFHPGLPVACINAAGSELDRTVPEGWALDRRAVRGPIEQNEAA